MEPTDVPLDDWTPLDPTQRESQISALRDWLTRSDRDAAPRVLDLGCGDGSLIESLLATDAAFTAVDNDPRAIQAALSRLPDSRRVQIVEADFTAPEHAARWSGAVDLVLCLGHTWMLVHEDAVARGVLTRVAEELNPTGTLVLDNFPDELWALVESGDWQTGLSEDGSCQMILDAQRGLIALRSDAEIDEHCEEFKPEDRLYRLWTVEQLATLAVGAGLQPPRVDAEHHLIWFDRT